MSRPIAAITRSSGHSATHLSERASLVQTRLDVTKLLYGLANGGDPGRYHRGRGLGADNKDDPRPETLAGKLIMLWPPPLTVKASLRSPLRAGGQATNLGARRKFFFGLGATPKAECLPAPAPPGRRAGESGR